LPTTPGKGIVFDKLKGDPVDCACTAIEKTPTAIAIAALTMIGSPEWS
jgi:hypothetical protein